YPDVAGVLQALKHNGVKIGVVSDIHVDLRLHAKEFGFAHHIDAWALSFELGVQKPDLRISQAALSQLGTAKRGNRQRSRPRSTSGVARHRSACAVYWWQRIGSKEKTL
ncbi:MAG: HAD hydrolase-like protein, partial [Acidimicrobiales bacterium]